MQRSEAVAVFPWAGLAVLAGAMVLLFAVVVPAPLSASDILQNWPLSRAAGIVAYLLFWASVCLGLIQSASAQRHPSGAAVKLDMHCFLALAALYTTVFHAAILVWNRHVPFHWQEALVPFASEYEPAQVGLGVLALYVLLGATVTTYLRGRLGPGLWRRVHQGSVLGFIMGLVHGLALGPDTGLLAMQLMYSLTGGSVAALGAWRVLKSAS